METTQKNINFKNTESGLILGGLGTGKSYHLRTMIKDVLNNTDADVIILDTFGEYSNLVQEFNGKEINLSLKGDNYINPLDMNDFYFGGSFLLKCDFMAALFQSIMDHCMKNNVYTLKELTPKQMSIIDRCTLSICQDKSKTHTLSDFKTLLENQPEDEAKDLAYMLSKYTGEEFNTFDHETNVDTDSRLLSYNIDKLYNFKFTWEHDINTISIGMLCVINSILNKISTNYKNGKHTYVFIEEGGNLIHFPLIAEFLYTLYKRSRVFRTTFYMVTNDVDSLTSIDCLKGLLHNTQYLFILPLRSTLDSIRLTEELALSESQSKKVKWNGLLFYEGEEIPFKGKDIQYI